MGGLAHLRCTFRRPWGAHVALYPLPSYRLTSPVVGVAGDWHHSLAYETPGIGTSADYAAAIVESAKRPAATSILE
jgi:hypothetical protein